MPLNRAWLEVRLHSVISQPPHRQVKYVLPFFAFALLIQGCSLFSTSDRGDLNDARARWERAEIRNYDFTLSLSCFCEGGGYAVSVRDRDIVTAEPLNGQSSGMQAELAVEDLFDVIINALAEDVDVLEVEYDGGLGYPTLISIDYFTDAVDDEITYTISDFERVDL